MSPIEFPESFLNLPVHLNGEEKAAAIAAGKSPRLQSLRDRHFAICNQLKQHENAIEQVMRHPAAELSAAEASLEQDIANRGEVPALARLERLRADKNQAHASCEKHRKAIATFGEELRNMAAEIAALETPAAV